MNVSDFEKLIAEALDSLPQQFAKALDNVEIVTELWPTDEELKDGHTPPGSTLFGLYHGIPQPQRLNYTGVLPDKIVIFMGPILAVYGDDPGKIKQQVKNTVLHELGHHFGLSDEEIRKTGK